MVKWCQRCDGDKMCLDTSNFEVQYEQIHFSVRWVWVCPYRVVSCLISDRWKVLIVPPVTKIWHKHHEDGSSTLKYLRRNCVLSSPYRQSEGFCTVSARVPIAAIKCSFGAEETCRHVHKVLQTDPLIQFDRVSWYDSDMKRGSSCRTDPMFLEFLFFMFFSWPAAGRSYEALST